MKREKKKNTLEGLPGPTVREEILQCYIVSRNEVQRSVESTFSVHVLPTKK